MVCYWIWGYDVVLGIAFWFDTYEVFEIEFWEGSPLCICFPVLTPDLSLFRLKVVFIWFLSFVIEVIWLLIFVAVVEFTSKLRESLCVN